MPKLKPHCPTPATKNPSTGPSQVPGGWLAATLKGPVLSLPVSSQVEGAYGGFQPRERFDPYLFQRKNKSHPPPRRPAGPAWPVCHQAGGRQATPTPTAMALFPTLQRPRPWIPAAGAYRMQTGSRAGITMALRRPHKRMKMTARTSHRHSDEGRSLGVWGCGYPFSRV